MTQSLTEIDATDNETVTGTTTDTTSTTSPSAGLPGSIRLLFNVVALRRAWGAVASVAPTRSPKPILQLVKLDADPDGSYLVATDLEIGVRHGVSGVKVDRAGSCLLDVARFGKILSATQDEELAIEMAGCEPGTSLADSNLVVKGLRSSFTLATDDPTLFPDMMARGEKNRHVANVASAVLIRIIKQTMFAVDMESTRYALGGCLVEFGEGSIAMVATDGRRLAKATGPADYLMSEEEGKPIGSTVVPLKALKALLRMLADKDDDELVQVWIDANKSIRFVADSATLYSRLVEGKFPKYQDVFPKTARATVTVEAGPFLAVVEQAAIVTSEESRGVDFRFGGGLFGDMVTLVSKTVNVGSSQVEHPVTFDGADKMPAIATCFDPGYLIPMLRAVEPSSLVAIDLIDAKSAVVFRAGDDYKYVVMPLTKE